MGEVPRLATTWLHPLASLDDQIDQIEIAKLGAVPRRSLSLATIVA
jgi:hypothetical protein